MSAKTPGELTALAEKHGIEAITPKSIILLAFDLARAIDHGVTIEAPHGQRSLWHFAISDQPLPQEAGEVKGQLALNPEVME